MDFQQIRNLIVTGSMSLSLLSAGAVFLGNSRIKTFGIAGLGSGISAVASLEIISGAISRERKRIEQTSESLIKEQAEAASEKEKKVIKLQAKIESKQKDIEQLNQGLIALEDRVKSGERALVLKNGELVQVQKELTEARLNLQSIARFNTSEAHRIVRETYNRQIKKVDCLINALIRNYTACSQELEKILSEVDKYKWKFLQEVESYEQIITFDDLLDIGLELQERIIDRSVELRCKAQRIILDNFELILEDAVGLEQVEEIVSSLTEEAKDKIEEVKGEWEADRQAIVSEWVVSNQGIVGRYQNEYTNTLNVAKEAAAKMEKLEAKLRQQEQELNELRKPMQAFGDSTYARASNAISAWYFQKGYILDFLDWSEIETGYKILYSIRRNPGISEKELSEDNSREQLAAFTNALYKTLPSFDFNRQNSTLTITVKMREKIKEVVTPKEFSQKVKSELAPPEKLIEFVTKAYHVGLWAETGSGKTTALSNIIGGMIQVLGGSPEIRSTIPKIDEQTQNIFPTIDWLGVPKSAFGLLEAALEIQYRIWKNEQAFLAGKQIEAFDPILFFIDEINLIFSRWGKTNDADIQNVLERFEETLSGERLEYFQDFMKVELLNYKNEFAKKLLLFIWQTGRSLNVKSLVAGQNLQPGAFNKMMINDIANCSYLALGDSIETCMKYKVKTVYRSSIEAERNELNQAIDADPNLRFSALCCPSEGKPYFGLMPAPNTYKWGKNLVSSNNLDVDTHNTSNQAQSYDTKELYTNSQALDISDKTANKADTKYIESPVLNTPKPLSVKDCSVYGQLPNWLKSLDYQGLVQMHSQLPKKEDGTVHKTKAYETVFKAKRRPEQRIISSFIDFLEAEFSL